MNPTTTFVMPMYNGARTVERAIASVVAQTISDWELLVIDDVSSDGSRELVRSIIESSADSRIRLIERDTNGGGPGPGRNTGVDHAQGRYVAFLDCDDEVLPEFLATLVPLLEDPETDVAVAAHIARTPSGSDTPRPDRVTGRLTGLEAADAIMQDKLWNYTHAKLYRYELLKKVRNREEVIRYEDLVFNAAVFSYSNMVHIVAAPVHIYYIAASSVTWSDEPSVWFINGTLSFLREDLNPAVKDQIDPRSWTTLKATLDVVTLSGALATGASETTVRLLLDHLRRDVTLAETARVAVIAPRIAASCLLVKVAPRLYGAIYRRYVRRTYELDV